MEDRLIPLAEVLSIVPVSSRTWERWILSGKAPGCVRTGEKRFWLLSDIRKWIEANRQTNVA